MPTLPNKMSILIPTPNNARRWKGALEMASGLGPAVVGYGYNKFARTPTWKSSVPTLRTVRAVVKASKNRRKAQWKRGRRRANNKRTVVSSRSTRRPSVRGKSVKMKGQKRPPKVSKAFKKAVTTALEKESPTGTYQNMGLTFVRNITTRLADNEQVWTDTLPFSLSTTADTTAFDDFGTLNFFTPNEVLDQASVLFAAKKKRNFWVTNTGGNIAGPGQKIHVDYAFAELVFQNNSQITKALDIYECVPKNTTEGNATPLQSFKNALSNDAGLNQNLPTVLDGSGVGSGVAAAITQLGVAPHFANEFTSNWKYSVKKLVLEPGQRQVVHLTGPNHFTYDYEKFVLPSGVFTNVVKGVGKYLMIRVESVDQLIADSTIAGTTVPIKQGNYSNSVTNTFGLTCLIKRYSKIKCPEQIGEPYRLENVYSIVPVGITAHGPAPNAAISKIDVEQPATEEKNAAQHGTGAAPFVPL